MEEKTAQTEIGGIRISNLMIDCADARQLAEFYAALLGLPIEQRYGLNTVAAPGLALIFSQEEDYVPPVWPEEPGKQQKMLHVDFVVGDLDAAVARAVSLGAVKAPIQFGPDEWITLFDPAGHPFCLCRSE